MKSFNCEICGKVGYHQIDRRNLRKLCTEHRAQSVAWFAHAASANYPEIRRLLHWARPNHRLQSYLFEVWGTYRRGNSTDPRSAYSYRADLQTLIAKGYNPILQTLDRMYKERREEMRMLAIECTDERELMLTVGDDYLRSIHYIKDMKHMSNQKTTDIPSPIRIPSNTDMNGDDKFNVLLDKTRAAFAEEVLIKCKKITLDLSRYDNMDAFRKFFVHLREWWKGYKVHYDSTLERACRDIWRDLYYLKYVACENGKEMKPTPENVERFHSFVTKVHHLVNFDVKEYTHGALRNVLKVYSDSYYESLFEDCHIFIRDHLTLYTK